VHFATLGVAAEPPVQVVRLNNLPFFNMMFLTEQTLLGVGFDFNPTLLNNSSSKGNVFLIDQLTIFLFSICPLSGHWEFNSVLDKVDEKANVAEDTGSSVSKARELFRSKTVRGQDVKSDTDVLKTKHERLITHVRNAGARNGAISMVSTTGLDGKLVLWNLASLDVNFSKLSL
jgi:actin related protein 2/3 complex, subunit 1A/1B